MKKFFSILAIMLCMTILIQSVPVYAIANAIDTEEADISVENTATASDTVTETAIKNADASEPYILGEMTDMRTVDTKIFRMSDGSFTAAVYPTQIHYEENGEMKEIDYRFEEVTVNGESFFKTKAGPVSLRVPETITDESEIVFSSGENSISFTLSSIEDIEAKKLESAKDEAWIASLCETIGYEMMDEADFETQFSKLKSEANVLDMELSEAIDELSDIMMSAPGAVSGVSYGSVMSGIDLNYSISGVTLKEEIVLNRQSTALKAFSFTLDPGELTPVLNSDKSVSLNNSEGSEQIKIASPFMYDAAGEESCAIEVALTDNEDGTYTYKLTPDKKWLGSAARFYPVTIDPPVTDSSYYNVKDTTGVFAQSAGSLDSAGEMNYLKVGKRYDSETGTTPEVQAMLYSALPQCLDYTTNIIHAYLNLYSYRGTFSSCPEDMQINAYMITSDWNTSNVMENNVLCLGNDGRSDYSNVLDYVYFNDATVEQDGKYYSFEITEAAQKWLNGEAANYGIALRGTNLGTYGNCARFYDSTNTAIRDEDGNQVLTCPKFIYVYRDSKGIEDYWSFTSMEAGRAGVAAVNNYNGNLVTVHDLVSSTGNNMPVSVSIIYSVNSNDNGTAGMGSWRTNYHMKVETCNLSFSLPGAETINYKYCFRDSDGTKHYLKEEGSEHKDEDGLGLTLTTADGSVTGYYYKIETKDHTEYQFDFYGRLIKIIDPNGNYNKVVYEEGSGSDSSKNRILYIEEGSKMSTSTRKTTFTLDSASGDITVRSPEGSFVVLDFMSSTNRMLNGIIYEDNISTAFTYTQIGAGYFPTKITDGRGHQTTISYISGASKRVVALGWGTQSTTLDQYIFTYNHNSTKVMDIKGRVTTLQFNGYGQTVGYVNHASSIGQSYEFGAPGGTGTGKGTENKLLMTSKTIYASENRISKGGMNTQSAASGFTVPSGIESSYVWIDGNTGTGALRLAKAATSTTNKLVYQRINGLEKGTYTISAYICTSGASLQGTGVYACADVYQGGVCTSSSGSSRVTYTKSGEWIRVQTTVEVTQDGAYAVAGIAFINDTIGAVYVDDIQFERNISGGAGSFNQLENPTFKGDFTSNWGGSGGFTVSAVGSDAPQGLTNMATVEGSPSTLKSLRQILYLNGKKDDVFIVGAWAKANSVPLGTDASNKKGAVDFGIHVTFYSGEAPIGETQTAVYNSGIEGWQFLTDKLIAPADYSRIDISLIYSFNTGSASFSAPFLYLESYGQSYVYDENGNVISSTDKAETEATFAYQDDSLTQSLSPTGSSYMYANDDTTYNTRYAVSNSGQKITFGYNGSGDATIMQINDLEFISQLEYAAGENVNCYIVNAKNGRVLEPHAMSAGNTVYVKDLGYNSSEMWQLKYLSGHVYSVRCLSNTALGLSTLSSGDGYQINTVTVNSAWVPDVPFKFAIIPNGDGTFKISTAKSGHTQYLYQTDSLHYSGSNSYTLRTGEYDEDDPAFDWYLVSTASGAAKMKTTAEYSADGRLLTASTDAAGNTRNFIYGSNGLVSTIIDARKNATNYTYDVMGRTTKVESLSSNVEYTYDSDLLKSILVDDKALVYGFNYDSFGRKTSVTVGNRTNSITLARYNYENTLLARQTYGNGAFIDFKYDSIDRLTKKIYNNDVSKYVNYLYDPNGNMYAVEDSIWNRRTIFEYDLAGRVTGTTTQFLDTKRMQAYESVRYNDGKGTVESISHTLFDKSGTKLKTLLYEYTYGDASKGEMPDALYEVTMGSRTFIYTYDDLGRVTGRTVSLVGKTASENYTYKQRADDTTFTTPLVNSMTDFSGVVHTYTYDANGNITKEVVGNKTIEYVYDAHNRLVEYYDQVANKAGKLTYDDRGNILSHVSGVYKSKAQIAQSGWGGYNSVTYTYGNTTWADLLTKFNGTSITYDNIGNPLNWINGETLTWQYGRQLKSVNGYTYAYNADGLRVSKTGGGKSTEYYIVNGQYIGEATTVNGTEYLISYFYDENGAVAGIYVGNTVYYFAKNIQGDVVAILDYTGAVVAKYIYDAWGNIIDVTYADGSTITSATHVAHLNPFRYRGYMYDEESGFYYLRSRYYDPEVGRFLNADGLVSTGQGIDGYNMFAYCNSNPVMFEDFDGQCLSVILDPLIRFSRLLKRLSQYIQENKRATTISDEGASFIASYEGFSPEIYDDCYGNPTIGYGHLIKNGETFTSITHEEALDLFKQDLHSFEEIVVNYMNANNAHFNQHQFDAMVSVAFNSGPQGFYNIADKIVLEQWDIQSAFTWYYTVEKAQSSNGNDGYLGLWRRRMDEADIYLYGTYTREDRIP